MERQKSLLGDLGVSGGDQRQKEKGGMFIRLFVEVYMNDSTTQQLHFYLVKVPLLTFDFRLSWPRPSPSTDARYGEWSA